MLDLCNLSYLVIEYVWVLCHHNGTEGDTGDSAQSLAGEINTTHREKRIIN